MKKHFDYAEPAFGKTLCGMTVTHLVQTIQWDAVDPDDPDQCKNCIRVMDADLGGDLS
jgi:hypothetical protein